MELTPAQKRATADLRCAARKLVPVLRALGRNELADIIESLVPKIVEAIKTR